MNWLKRLIVKARMYRLAHEAKWIEEELDWLDEDEYLIPRKRITFRQELARVRRQHQAAQVELAWLEGVKSVAQEGRAE